VVSRRPRTGHTLARITESYSGVVFVARAGRVLNPECSVLIPQFASPQSCLNFAVVDHGSVGATDKGWQRGRRLSQ
jgi:hypothetical protein